MEEKLYPFVFNGKTYNSEAEVDDVFACFYTCREALTFDGVYVADGMWVDPEGEWEED